MDFARENINHLRGRRSINQIADEAKVGQSWLQRYMNPDKPSGIRKANPDKLRAIAGVLGVSLDALLHQNLTLASASHPVELQRQMIAAVVTLIRHVEDSVLDPIPESRRAELVNAATAEVMENWSHGLSEKDVPAAGRAVIARMRDGGR